MNETKQKIQLSAIDPFIVDNLPDNTESKARGKDYINWGSDNKYADYLWSLYQDVATLQTIINGTVDFICGDDIQCNVPTFEKVVNKDGETIRDIVKKIALDEMIFGGFALQVIRNYVGGTAEIYALDFMKVRTNEKNDIIYYSDDWSKWGAKYLIYPKFKPGDENPTSVFYYKGHLTRSTYPIPLYGAAIIPCELEKSINQFHLNNINNGFMSNLIINFNNGQPNDEQKEEIERCINEKFSGYQNAGRILISYNDSDDNKTTVERLSGDDFDDKYNALSERSKSQIFTAFRAQPILFGDMPDKTGFNEVEFNEAFKLYSKVVVSPLQDDIKSVFDKIFGVEGSITITPFSLTPKGNETVA